MTSMSTINANSAFFVAACTPQLLGAKLMVRRLVTGLETGWKRQRFTAASVSLLKTRAGLALITRAEVTEPLVPTVNSTCTEPVAPARCAACG